MHGAIVATLHVILTGPHKLDGSPGQAPGDGCGLTLDVCIWSCAPSEAPARHLGVKHHLLRLEPKDFGDGGLIDRLKLGAGPYFRAIAIEPYGGVERLHGSVGQIRELILRDDTVRCGNAFDGGSVAAGGGSHARAARE